MAAAWRVTPASRRLDLPPCALRQGRLDASRPGIVREARRPLIGAALAVVSSAAYALADRANVATDSTTTDTIVWEKIVFGVLFPPAGRSQLAQPPSDFTQAGTGLKRRLRDRRRRLSYGEWPG